MIRVIIVYVWGMFLSASISLPSLISNWIGDDNILLLNIIFVSLYRNFPLLFTFFFCVCHVLNLFSVFYHKSLLTHMWFRNILRYRLLHFLKHDFTKNQILSCTAMVISFLRMKAVNLQGDNKTCSEWLLQDCSKVSLLNRVTDMAGRKVVQITTRIKQIRRKTQASGTF